jgi:hypothetical protein
MSDLRVYIDGRKKRDPEFAENYEKGFQDFKLGVMLRQAREDAGLTQEELAVRISPKKTAISRKGGSNLAPPTFMVPIISVRYVIHCNRLSCNNLFH